ncbi:MAG: carboxypeptidase regulatory-like domain-containing protein [Ignavibacteriales bacterium]|nr:carboxypeptidase regulatory-like domain-containing protein [Ignavibacteriales bacterium]
MNKIIKYSAVFICVYSVMTFAQTGTLTGLVFDAESEKPISSATITIKEINLFSTSDSNGFYSIFEIPVGKYTVDFVKNDYLPFSVNGLRIDTAKPRELEIGLLHEYYLDYYDSAFIKSNLFPTENLAQPFILDNNYFTLGDKHNNHKTYFNKYIKGYNALILQAIDKVQTTALDGGGYFIGIKAEPPESPIGYKLKLFGNELIEPPRKTSYCSGSTYTAFIEALNLIFEYQEKPLTYEVYEAMRMQELDNGRREDDIKFWGKWNADGFGNHFALVQYSDMGKIIEPNNALPGDFMNISWTNGGGHSVIFLGWHLDDTGELNVVYWSSQKSTNGISDQVVPISRINEVMVVRLTKPEKLFYLDVNKSTSYDVKGCKISSERIKEANDGM